jgi:hypothetical protein
MRLPNFRFAEQGATLGTAVLGLVLQGVLELQQKGSAVERLLACLEDVQVKVLQVVVLVKLGLQLGREVLVRLRLVQVEVFKDALELQLESASIPSFSRVLQLPIGCLIEPVLRQHVLRVLVAPPLHHACRPLRLR